MLLLNRGYDWKRASVTVIDSSESNNQDVSTGGWLGWTDCKYWLNLEATWGEPQVEKPGLIFRVISELSIDRASPNGVNQLEDRILQGH